MSVFIDGAKRPRQGRGLPAEAPAAFWRGGPGVGGGVLFALLLLLFLRSPVDRSGSDPCFTMLQSETLLHKGTLRLDDSFVRPLDRAIHVWVGANGLPYQVREINGHIYCYYPPGSSLLSLPFVALLNAAGLRAHQPDWEFNPAGEARMQRIIAAVLLALLGALIFAVCRRGLPVSWSLFVMLAVMLGTPVWSNISLALWSDTWGIVLLQLAIMQLLALERGADGEWRAFALAVLAALLFAVKPTYAIDIALISLFLLLRHRRLFWLYALFGAGWGLLFVAYSLYFFGSVLPEYYLLGGDLGWRHWGTALAGVLISPSRGLLIFSPWLIWPVWLALRHRRSLPHRPLCLLAAASIVSGVLLVSLWPIWWGGHSYGPRLFAGLTPWFALLALCGVRAMLEDRAQAPFALGRWRGRLAVTAGAALAIVSVFIHGVGAHSQRAWQWNHGLSLDGGHQPLLVWDWRRPQFFEPWASAISAFPAAPYRTGSRIVFGGPDAMRFLATGWSVPEGTYNWSEAEEASIVWRQERPSGVALHLRFVPYLVRDALDRQRVIVLLNGEVIDAFAVTDGESQSRRVLIPRALLMQRNTLTLRFPDARSPKELGVGTDDRTLGIALQEFWLE